MIDKEMVDSIKDAIDSLGTTTYCGTWDSALVEGVDGERYHAITNNDDVVVRADDDNRHSSWLCDYLELVSPVNMLKLIAQLEAAQRDRNMHYQVSEKFRIELIAAEAALSAANEKLSKPVVLPDDGLDDCINMWPDNWRNDFDTGYNFGVWRCEQNIKAAGFAVEE
ncbi:hypothetical protein RSG06_002230 [Yersinia enterocolitica]|nr:hypothetical protein [Yersinia enterocolitica]